MEFRIKASRTLWGQPEKELVFTDHDERFVTLEMDGEAIGLVSRKELKRLAQAL